MLPSDPPIALASYRLLVAVDRQADRKRRGGGGERERARDERIGMGLRQPGKICKTGHGSDVYMYIYNYNIYLLCISAYHMYNIYIYNIYIYIL